MNARSLTASLLLTAAVLVVLGAIAARWRWLPAVLPDAAAPTRTQSPADPAPDPVTEPGAGLENPSPLDWSVAKPSSADVWATASRETAERGRELLLADQRAWAAVAYSRKAPPIEPPAIQFDALTLAQARELSGAEVRITFTPGRPAYTCPMGGAVRTVAGPAERDDDQERTVYLRGDRVRELRGGEPMTIRGRLRVIDHPAAAVNGRAIAAWSEVRFEEG